MKLLRIKTVVCSNNQVMVTPSLVEYADAKKEYDRAQIEGVVTGEIGDWYEGPFPRLAETDCDEALFTIMTLAGDTVINEENSDFYLPKVEDPDADDKALQIEFFVL